MVMTTATAADGTALAHSTAGEVIACHECGTVHRLPAMPNDTVARCIACDAKIYIRFEGTIERTLALYLAALALFLVANAFPIMSMAIAGQSNASTILDSAKALYDDGMWPLALAVGLAGCVIPLAKILGMLAVLIPLQLGRQPSWVFGGFRWVERFQPWAMMEVSLLGVIVAYVKMQDLATVHVGVAMYAFIGTILLLAAAEPASTRMQSGGGWPRRPATMSWPRALTPSCSPAKPATRWCGPRPRTCTAWTARAEAKRSTGASRTA
jgi:paraquat-inducible protein A